MEKTLENVKCFIEFGDPRQTVKQYDQEQVKDNFIKYGSNSLILKHILHPEELDNSDFHIDPNITSDDIKGKL